MATAQTLVTAEELSRLPNPSDLRRELVRGVLVEMSPVGGGHGSVVGKLIIRLGNWAERGPGGYVGTEAGFVLAKDGATVRAADVAYVRADRIPAAGIPSGYWSLAPDLAVEVLSPNESAQDINEKVRDYLGAGTRLMWVVYPRTREVHEYTQGHQIRIFTAEDTLAHEAVLPGFRCAVADIFS